MEEVSHCEEASGQLALEVYNEDNLRTERESWIAQATSAFGDIANANKNTLRHVELILPTGGIATPLNLLPLLIGIENLESLCVQWPMRGYLPMTTLLMSQWSHILEDSIATNFAQFHGDLMKLLGIHARSLKRLRISLPQSTSRKPFSALSINVSSFLSLSALEILDLTHWSPKIADITSLLGPGRPAPTLQHLIIDHGTELPLSDGDGFDDDEEVGPDYDWDNPPPRIETNSWPAPGAHLVAREPPLRSLSAALHDTRYSFAPVGCRLALASLRKLLRDGAGENTAALDGLRVANWVRGKGAGRQRQGGGRLVPACSRVRAFRVSG